MAALSAAAPGVSGFTSNRCVVLWIAGDGVTSGRRTCEIEPYPVGEGSALRLGLSGMSIVLSGVRVSSRSSKAGRTREVDVRPSTFALYVTLARAVALFNMSLGPGTRTSISKRKVQVSGFRSVLGPERKSRSTV